MNKSICNDFALELELALALALALEPELEPGFVKAPGRASLLLNLLLY